MRAEAKKQSRLIFSPANYISERRKAQCLCRMLNALCASEYTYKTASTVRSHRRQPRWQQRGKSTLWTKRFSFTRTCTSSTLPCQWEVSPSCCSSWSCAAWGSRCAAASWRGKETPWGPTTKPTGQARGPKTDCITRHKNQLLFRIKIFPLEKFLNYECLNTFKFRWKIYIYIYT